MKKSADFCRPTKIGRREKFSNVIENHKFCRRKSEIVVYKMETEWKEEAILKLIELYEKTPILYDPSHHNYRNRDMKRQKELLSLMRLIIDSDSTKMSTTLYSQLSTCNRGLSRQGRSPPGWQKRRQKGLGDEVGNGPPFRRSAIPGIHGVRVRVRLGIGLGLRLGLG